MSLFSIADLHLSLSVNKPMDKFGSRWTNYTEKIEKRWRAVVGPDDTVIVPGDISWAIDLDQALADLSFIHALPGKKILGKGNHDYWWSTIRKMESFIVQNNLSSIRFLQNNAFVVEDYIVTGTRGWYLEEKQQTAQNADFAKVAAREISGCSSVWKRQKSCRTIPVTLFWYIFTFLPCIVILFAGSWWTRSMHIKFKIVTSDISMELTISRKPPHLKTFP